jgi:hypothetical protein
MGVGLYAARTAEGKARQDAARERLTRDKARFFQKGARSAAPPPGEDEAARLVAEFLARGGRVRVVEPAEAAGVSASAADIPAPPGAPPPPGRPDD